MSVRYVNFCVNLDDRTADGKPKLIKSPEDGVIFNSEDLVLLSISVIENGVEDVLAKHSISYDPVRVEQLKGLIH